MFWDCGVKPEYPQKTMQTEGEPAWPGHEPVTFWLLQHHCRILILILMLTLIQTKWQSNMLHTYILDLINFLIISMDPKYICFYIFFPPLVNHKHWKIIYIITLMCLKLMTLAEKEQAPALCDVTHWFVQVCWHAPNYSIFLSFKFLLIMESFAN